MSTERASLDGLETYQRVSHGCIVSRWHHIILLAGLIQIRLHLPIDDLMDERDIVHDCEMGTLADVHLQTRVGETSPAQCVVARHIGIALRREARNWNFPWRF